MPSTCACWEKTACPGTSLMSIFLVDTNGRQSIVLPLSKVNAYTASFLRLLSYMIFFMFMVAFIFDVVDVAAGGDYRETPYGKMNPLISLISFCASQIGFFMASSAGFFLITKSEAILKCAESLQTLIHTFGLDTQKIKGKCTFPQLIQIRGYFYTVIVLALVRFLMAVQSLSNFWDPSGSYAKLPVPVGIQLLYAHGTMLLSILFYYPINILFTYLSSFLVSCTTAFYAENESVLKSLSSYSPPNDSSTVFLQQLKRMRNRQELIYATFDQVQKTFSLKLFLDMAGNLSVVLSGIAWFSIWGADPSGTAPISTARHVLAAAIYLLTVWVVGNQPLALYVQVIKNLNF